MAIQVNIPQAVKMISTAVRTITRQSAKKVVTAAPLWSVFPITDAPKEMLPEAQIESFVASLEIIKNPVVMCTVIPLRFEKRKGVLFANLDMINMPVSAQYFSGDTTLYSGVISEQKDGKFGTQVFFTPDAGQGIYSGGKWINVCEIEGYLVAN